jgi:hypothetical protein
MKITRTRQSYFRANLLKVGLVLSNYANSAIANSEKELLQKYNAPHILQHSQEQARCLFHKE